MKNKNITIIYASTSGNTEMVVDYVADILKESGINVSLHRAEAASKEILLDNDLLILATSTWGHGILNPFFGEMLKVIEGNSMSGKKAAFIGLGDAKYEEAYINEGVEILKRAFLGADGEEIHRTLKILGEPHKFMDLLVKKWAEDLVGILKDN